ncbi:TBC1 domain family member 19 [Paragonimus skrjabini miyazakii]|uniref:TBC1 domain family member 19 n=1 Tax=Paragonimus skrjabini miyazakii TaxID=59628 RepID=A0A8S9YMC6_9TREM|nr:TBC1 domain family member 19 [Paragonimus skrjabini miyazakii]
MIKIRSCAKSDVSQRTISEELLKRIKASPTELHLLQDALQSVHNLEGNPKDLEKIVLELLPNTESYQGLKNWIFQEKEKVISRLRYDWIVSEPSTFGSWSYLQKAQASWERKMLRSLSAMCQELGIRLAVKRDPKQSEAILQNWTELSLVFNKPSVIKPVFGPKDLLEVLICIRHPNMKYTTRSATENSSNMSFPNWGLFNLPIRVKDITALSEFFSPLSIDQPQYGIDELFSPSFGLSREQEAEEGRSHLMGTEAQIQKLFYSVIRSKSSAEAQVYLQRGCPLGYRAQVWSLYLNVHVTEADVLYYNQLKLRIAEEECMTDQLVCKEVQLTASNDEMHFVFCDYTYQVLLPFTRDATIQEHFNTTLASAPRAITKQAHESMIFPPSGVIPFHGFSMYVLSLCYLYDDPVMLYMVFRELYIRYFHKLHTISNDCSGVLSLCILFERLLQVREPQLFFHLRSHGIQP